MASPQHQIVNSRTDNNNQEDVLKSFKPEPELQLMLQLQNDYATLLQDSRSLDSLTDLCRNFNDHISWEKCGAAGSEEPSNFACLCYNIAAANFHARNYDVSQRILTYLIVEWRQMSDVSTSISWKIRLLLADTLLRQRKFTTALVYVDQLEFLKYQLELDAKKLPEDSSILVSSDKDEWICNIKSRIQLYKTFCYLACRSLKAAKRECKILFGMLGTSSQCHLGAMHLKAYQEYLRGNMTKAVNLIRNVPINAMPTPHDLLIMSGDLLTVLAANNEGCCQFYLGRPLSAGMFFKKAIIAFDEEVPAHEELPLHALSYRMDSLKCLYNFGISCLHAKDSERAFHCLMSCSKHFGRNPRLWLRIAECCIQKYQLTNENIMRQTEDPDTSCTGQGTERPSENIGNASSDGSKPSLSFGLQCIKTSLAMLSSQRVKNSQMVDVPPSNPLITEKDICELHASILCAGSYLCVQTEDYCTSVAYLQELLSLPYLPGLYKYLGTQYLSQSLYKLDEIEKAISSYEGASNPIDLTISLTSGEVAEDTIESSPAGSLSQSHDSNSSIAKKPLLAWYPPDEWTARLIQTYNRACLLVRIGKFDEAEEYLKVWTMGHRDSLPPDFLTLAAFVYSKLGNTTKAAGLLNQRYSATLRA